MKVSAIKLFNVRSFLDSDNYLMIDDRKTSIIGVNESGKSNILEAIGKLNFVGKLPNYYNSIKNLSAPEEDVKILVELYFNESEMQQFSISGDIENTLLTFEVGKNTIISGGLSRVIACNETIKNVMGCIKIFG